jgi:hypothetical protein
MSAASRFISFFRTRPESRPLTAAERAGAPAFIAAAIDLGAVRIIGAYHNPYAALARITVVRGASIYWGEAPAEAQTLQSRAHLAHELTHVWHYLACGRSGFSLLLDRRYLYRLRRGAQFSDFGAEQQAAIVEDWVLLGAGAPARWARGDVDIQALDRLIGGVQPSQWRAAKRR